MTMLMVMKTNTKKKLPSDKDNDDNNLEEEEIKERSIQRKIQNISNIKKNQTKEVY